MIINSSNLNEKKIHKLITSNFDKLAPAYYKLLSEWMNSSYEKLQDIDKYRILLYLINKDFEYYIKNELVESYDNFFLYDKSLELDHINIKEISNILRIPKESTRRKIIHLEKLGIIQKIKKKVYIDRSAYNLIQPKVSLKNLCALLTLISEICKKENLINKKLEFFEISNLLKENFTYCWFFFYKFIFILTQRWKQHVGDLEIFSVGMVIVCHSVVNKSYHGTGLNFAELDKDKKNNEESGVNAMSISEITNIPRPTVVRKLNYLLKNKYISINKKKLFTVNIKDKSLNDIITIQENNILSLTDLVLKIFNKIDIK